MITHTTTATSEEFPSDQHPAVEREEEIEMSESATDHIGKYVVVTTLHKGVFAGRLQEADEKFDTVVVEDMRNCLYWSADVGGLWGLAATGPTSECRIGAVSPKVRLLNVTAIAECSPEAEKAWIDAPVWRGS